MKKDIASAEPPATPTDPTDPTDATASTQSLGQRLSDVQEQAAHILATGAGHRQASLALGVTEARIAQLVADPAVTERIEELALEHAKAVNDRFQSYTELEKTLIAHINTSIGFSDFKDAVSALKVVSSIQLSNNRSGGAAAARTPEATPLVQVVLPEHAAAKLTYTTNERNEIVTVEGKPLVSMPSDTVEAMLTAQTKLVRADGAGDEDE